MLLLNYQSINVLTYHHSKIPSVCETFFKTIRQNFNYDLQRYYTLVKNKPNNRSEAQISLFQTKSTKERRSEASGIGGPPKAEAGSRLDPPLPPFLQGCDYPDIVVTLDGSSIYKTHWARGGRRLARTRHNVRVTHPAHHAPLAPSPLSLSLSARLPSIAGIDPRKSDPGARLPTRW